MQRHENDDYAPPATPPAVDREVGRRLALAYRTLCLKLIGLDYAALPISDYSKRYLGEILGAVDVAVARYVTILEHLLVLTPFQSLGATRLIDYGGGTGLLSLLAREAGVGEVYYNDIYEVSCHDAKVLAGALGLERRGYLPGDLPAVAARCRELDLRFDCIGSYDVIEHIYDMHEFLSRIEAIAAPRCVMFMLSGANPYNPTIVAELTATQERIENQDRTPGYGHKQRDSTRAYLAIRRDIVRSILKLRHASLSESETESLAKATRGLAKKDIAKAVQTYLRSGILPEPDRRFPGNTCDPVTGNWAEHLMDFEALLGTLRQTLFSDCRLSPDAAALPASPTIGLMAVRQPASEAEQGNRGD